MADIIFYSIAIFFSSFGIISFCMFAIDFFYESRYLKNKEVYTVFVAKNEICSIENIARAIAFKAQKNCSGVCDSKIIAIDDGSCDGTYGILKRMEKSEKKICVLRKKDIIKLLEEKSAENS